MPDWYPEAELFSFPVYPNRESHDVVTGPYNSLLSTEKIQKSMNVVVPFDNAGLAKHVKKREDAARPGSSTSTSSSKGSTGYDKLINVIVKCMLDLTAHF